MIRNFTVWGDVGPVVVVPLLEELDAVVLDVAVELEEVELDVAVAVDVLVALELVALLLVAILLALEVELDAAEVPVLVPEPVAFVPPVPPLWSSGGS